MNRPVLVLVHSPLVGPFTWRPVADRLTAADWTSTVPDLTAVMAGPGPYQPPIAQAVAAAADHLARPVVLVGHSGAGPLLPAIAAALAVPVRALVYVDAGLPHPGQTWFETAPADLAEHLHALADGGRLPPWHEWLPPEAVAALVPDADLRARLTAELSPLPVAFFDEPRPPATWSGPFGYLLLSEGYQDDADRAAEAGAPVMEHRSHHLALVTSPEPVAATLQELLTALDR